MVQITCLVESELLAAKHRCSVEAADVADMRSNRVETVDGMSRMRQTEMSRETAR